MKGIVNRMFSQQILFRERRIKLRETKPMIDTTRSKEISRTFFRNFSLFSTKNKKIKKVSFTSILVSPSFPPFFWTRDLQRVWESRTGYAYGFSNLLNYYLITTEDIFKSPPFTVCNSENIGWMVTWQIWAFQWQL